MILLILLAYSLLVPNNLRSTHAWIPDDARLNGVACLGGPGSGKSRLVGRLIAFLDFVRGIPVVILDPTGSTIDNFVHRLLLLPQTHQERLWRRVIYVDMSGQEKIVPFPLYYRLSDTESLASVAKRFVETVRRLDPNLSNAAMEGWNAVSRLGTNAGMILAALGLQITEAEDLIRNPAQWRPRFDQALTAFPEVRPAVDFFLEWGNDRKTKPDYRLRRSESFLSKIQLFQLDPTMRAMFGASAPGLNWAPLFHQGYTVLIDFRHELTEEYRRFKLLWVFMYLYTYLNARGPAGRTQPVSVVIDELTEFVNFRASDGKSVLADDLERLVSVIGRNYGVWLTLASQGLSQFDERIQKMLGRMGSQIIGNTPDAEEAAYFARQLIPYDPYLLKKKERVWMKIDPMPIMTFFGGSEFPTPKVIDHRTIELSPAEQSLLGMRQFQELEKLTFLVKLATAEGNLAAPLQKMSIASIDAGLYPDPLHISQVRRLLSSRHGFEKDRLLAEIDKRLSWEVPKKQVKSPHESAKLNNSSTPDQDSANQLSVVPEPATPVVLNDDHVTTTISTNKSLLRRNDTADKRTVPATEESARTRSGWEPLPEGEEE